MADTKFKPGDIVIIPLEHDSSKKYVVLECKDNSAKLLSSNMKSSRICKVKGLSDKVIFEESESYLKIVESDKSY